MTDFYIQVGLVKPDTAQSLKQKRQQTIAQVTMKPAFNF